MEFVLYGVDCRSWILFGLGWLFVCVGIFGLWVIVYLDCDILYLVGVGLGWRWVGLLLVWLGLYFGCWKWCLV